MSRPRKPTAELENSGAFEKNPSRALARSNEPANVPDLGNPPTCLSKDEKRIWKECRRIAPWITAADAYALESVCRLVVKMRTGAMKSADYSVLRSLLSALGLTPGDRSKVSVPSDKQPEIDEFAAFMRSAGMPDETVCRDRS